MSTTRLSPARLYASSVTTQKKPASTAAKKPAAAAKPVEKKPTVAAKPAEKKTPAPIEEDTDEINLTLADVGPGIPDIEKTMQDGYSTATDQVRNLGFGAGMGLPNMKRNSDEISIETELGVGTTVRMKILNQ